MTPLILLLLGTVPSCDTGAKEARVRVGLYADFQHEPSTAVRAVIQDELAAIMVPIGPTLEWRSLAENKGDERWTMLVVVHFKGKCDLSDLSTYPPYPWILGRTHLSDGAIIPFSDIYCGAIRAFLAPSLVSMDEQSRTFVFGRAIGRVLAHELYHVLAGTKHHGSSGLGEAFYTPRELVADDFQFQDQEIQRVRLAIAPPLGNIATQRGDHLCRGKTK